mgnify:CR=1 FL=1
MIRKVSRMEQIVQSYVADKQFMGSILVAQNGNVLLDKGYGYANLEWQIPNSPTTKFRLASLTKQFTAASILLLEEKGKLKLTDPVKKYIPDAPLAWENITLFHLLTHTSGIPNYTSFPEFSLLTTSTKTPEQQVKLFRDRPLDFQPGIGYAYNNSGYVLLGHLIEIISDQAYQDFVVDNLFKTLGMDDSGYDSFSTIIPHRASGYVMTANGIQNADYLDMSIPYSAGSLYSTTKDLLRWTGIFNGLFLSSESLQKMITPFKNNYGLGVVIQSIDGHSAIHHTGGINGFATMLIYCPKNKIMVAVLSNLNAIGYVAQDIAIKIIKLMHGKEVILPAERKEAVISPDILARYIGTYQVKSTNESYAIHIKNLVIAIENGYLTAQVENNPKMRLFPESETQFFGKIPIAQIEFFNDRQGNISHLVWHQDEEDSVGVKSQ